MIAVAFEIGGRECRSEAEGLDVVADLYADVCRREHGLAESRVRLGRALNELRSRIPSGRWRASLAARRIPYHVAKRAMRLAREIDQVAAERGDDAARALVDDAGSLRELELGVGVRTDRPIDRDEVAPLKLIEPATARRSESRLGDPAPHLPGRDVGAGGGVPSSFAAPAPAEVPPVQLELGPLYQEAAEVRAALHRLSDAASDLDPTIAEIVRRFEGELDEALGKLAHEKGAA